MNRQTLVVLLLAGVMAVGAVLWLGSGTEAVPEPVEMPVETAPVAAVPEPEPTPVAPTTPAPVRSQPTSAPLPVEIESVVPAAPTTATLHISSDVPGAQVFVDRKFIGEAPTTAEGVAPGSHQINVSAPGYDAVVETFDIEVGPRDIVISLKTIRLDQSIAVKHKHRFGSCEGQLIATPEGLRYETSNDNDGFSVALVDIETFEVDFTDKNLRVKIRDGRSYDFTDPDDSADPLYFFHQEVEKVRQRLIKGGQ